MKKLYHYLLLLLCCLSFSSCIEIIEEITINPDKSGKISFTLDIGGIGRIMLQNPTKELDLSFMEDVKKQPELSAGILKDFKGIKNLKPVIDEKKGLYSLNFEFDNSKDLNKSFYKLFDLKKKFFEPSIIKITKGKLVKRNLGPVLRYIVNKHIDKIPKKEGVLKLIKYKAIYHFPDEVKKVSNKRASIKNDNKTVVFQCTLDELLNTDINIGNKIRY